MPTHVQYWQSEWMAPADVKLSLASAVTFHWPEPRHAVIVGIGSLRGKHATSGRFPSAVPPPSAVPQLGATQKRGSNAALPSFLILMSRVDPATVRG